MEQIYNVISFLLNSQFGGSWTPTGGIVTYGNQYTADVAWKEFERVHGGGGEDKKNKEVKYLYFSMRNMLLRNKIGISSGKIPDAFLHIQISGNALTGMEIVEISLFTPKIVDYLDNASGHVFNGDNAVYYLNEHAYPKYDRATCGNCAKAVRLSLEAGGINTTTRPNSAKDYGPYLVMWGFDTVDRTGYSPLKGDIRVFQNYPGGSMHGHINMYNGNQWVSDFFENGFWPGRGYRENSAAFTIYRKSDWVITVKH
ncbi:MAG: hypothetical protein KGZ97_05360 [Bacteroidetes bacterium]|nr:hypothetical protein [Bacteroidota bacterium]